jgi:hypothetical protein
MFQRLITKTLTAAAEKFPVTVLTGPRQSGKTTLLREFFPDYHYVSLEAPDTLLYAKEDPRGFLQTSGQHCIIDEAQHYPELFSYLQEILDELRQKRRYILSGSQNFLLAERVSQTLAGRSVILELLPLSYAEYLSEKSSPPLSIWEFLYHGGYPRPYHEKLPIKLWYESYIRTYLERDIRSLVNVKDLAKFQLFLKLCAGRHGQLLNMNALANDAGVSHTTVTHWLSMLEASYIVFRLAPYYKNFNKRLVKTPKLYFFDSAIVCMLSGIESPEHLQFHASRGAIFEGFVLAELYKTALAKGHRPSVYFWRDHAGMEIDVLIETGGQLRAIEIKSGSTVTQDYFENLYRFQETTHTPASHCNIVYAGKNHLQRHGISVVPWNDIMKLMS